MEKNIVFIGMMGCGKTTVGKLLSQRLNRPLVDTDELIEQREGRPIPEIFASDGEGAFRALELELCRELSRQSGLIIACGGGLPLQDGAISLLKENSLVFWLDRDPEETYDTLDVSGRPLAQAGREDFLKRYAARTPIYRRWADRVIPIPAWPEDTAGLIDTICKEVTEL